jgi:hypothetical protein
MKEVRSPWTSGGNPVHSPGKPHSPGARSSRPQSLPRADQMTAPIRAPISHGDQGGTLAVHGPEGPQPMPDSAPQGEPQERETAVDRDPHEEQE